MTGCFFHFRNSYSGDRKSRHFTFYFGVAAFSIGSKIKVFGTEIPHSVRAKEISAEGKVFSPMTLAARWQSGIKI